MTFISLDKIIVQNIILLCVIYAHMKFAAQ